MRKTWKKLLALGLVGMMTLSLAACGGAGGNGEGQKTGDTSAVTETGGASGGDFTPYTFTDSLGRELEITEEITAIAPSGQLAQVILMGVASDMFVGLGGNLYDEAGIYVDDYDRLSELTFFGTIVGNTDLDYEALAATEADVIVDMGYAKEGLEEALADVEAKTGIPCVFIEADLSTYPEAIRQVGQLLNRQDAAEEMAVWCQETYDRAIRIMDQVGDNKVTGLYVLGESAANVIASTTTMAEVLDLMTDNVAVLEEFVTSGKGTEVNMEQIALWDPEFVIFASDAIYDTAAEDPLWSEISAIKNGMYVECPNTPYNWAVSPPAAQRYLALLWLPAILYPEYVDYDLKEEIKEYYELFCGYSMTDEEYDILTENIYIKEQ